MKCAYTELVLVLGSDTTINFDIKSLDGEPVDLSSYSSGSVYIKNIQINSSSVNIGSVEIEPESVKGRVSVNIDRNKLNENYSPIFEQDYSISLYDYPQFNFSMAVTIEKTNSSGSVTEKNVIIRAKVRLVKAGE